MPRFADALESFGFDSDLVGEHARGCGVARTAEDEALDHAHTELTDELQVVVSLDALRASVHAQRFGKRDDGADDGGVAVG